MGSVIDIGSSLLYVDAVVDDTLNRREVEGVIAIVELLGEVLAGDVISLEEHLPLAAADSDPDRGTEGVLAIKPVQPGSRLRRHPHTDVTAERSAEGRAGVDECAIEPGLGNRELGEMRTEADIITDGDLTRDRHHHLCTGPLGGHGGVEHSAEKQRDQNDEGALHRIS